MIAEKLLPITFVGWDVFNKANDFVFYQVHFTKAFGPWNKDEYCNTIQFLISDARLIEVNAQGQVIKEANIDISIREPESEEVQEEPAIEGEELSVEIVAGTPSI